jgi:hypothetical protein
MTGVLNLFEEVPLPTQLRRAFVAEANRAGQAPQPLLTKALEAWRQRWAALTEQRDEVPLTIGGALLCEVNALARRDGLTDCEELAVLLHIGIHLRADMALHEEVYVIDADDCEVRPEFSEWSGLPWPDYDGSPPEPLCARRDLLRDLAARSDRLCGEASFACVDAAASWVETQAVRRAFPSAPSAAVRRDYLLLAHDLRYIRLLAVADQVSCLQEAGMLLRAVIELRKLAHEHHQAYYMVDAGGSLYRRTFIDC